MTGRPRRWLVAIVAAAPAIAGCAIDEVTPAPTCDGGWSTVIVAQSVPDASFVPCIEPRGAGWHAVRVQVDEGGTQLRFSLGPDRRVSGEVSFTETCPVGSGAPLESGVIGVEVGEIAPSGRRYRFSGGCVVVKIAAGVGAEAAEALIESVVLVERARLAADLRRDFVDEEL